MAEKIVSDADPEKAQQRTCCQKVKGCLTLAPEGATPVNYKVMSLCVLALFSSSFTITFLFPFLPEMVLSFGYAEDEKGYYAGIIASSMFAGRAFGSYFWGWLSDRKGRRLVLLVTVFGNGVFALAFGFTRDLTQAIVFRFLTGLCNGSVGTTKTILYEISDNTNQAVGMSALALAWGAGVIVGPAIGGYLASPAKKYPDLFSPDGFLGEFPYVLPSIVSFTISVVATIVLFWKLPETLKRTSVSEEIESKTVEDGDATQHINGSDQEVKVIRSSQPFAKSAEDCPSRSTDFRRFLSLESVNCDTRLSPYMGLERPSAKRDSDKLIGSKRVYDTAATSSCTALQLQLDRSEYDPLPISEHKRKMSVSENALNFSKLIERPPIKVEPNGFHLNNHGMLHASEKQEEIAEIQDDKNLEIRVNGKHEDNPASKALLDKPSTANTSSAPCHRVFTAVRNWSVVTLLGQADVRHSVFLYTLFSFSVIGNEEVFTVWASTEPYYDGLGFSTDALGTVIGVAAIPLFCLQIFIFPALAKRFGLIRTFCICACVTMTMTLATPMLHLLYDKPGWLWTGLMVTQMPMKVCVTCAFGCSSLFINNSVSPQTAGAVNGLAMTSTAIARTMAPTIGGSIFAWSISYGTFHIGAPFDVNLTFLMFSLFYWLSALYSVFMPERLNRQNKK